MSRCVLPLASSYPSKARENVRRRECCKEVDSSLLPCIVPILLSARADGQTSTTGHAICIRFQRMVTGGLKKEGPKCRAVRWALGRRGRGTAHASPGRSAVVSQASLVSQTVQASPRLFPSQKVSQERASGQPAHRGGHAPGDRSGAAARPSRGTRDRGESLRAARPWRRSGITSATRPFRRTGRFY